MCKLNNNDTRMIPILKLSHSKTLRKRHNIKLLSRLLNSRLFQVNLVHSLRKITLLLDSCLLFKNNSTPRFDLLFEFTHPFHTPRLNGDGEGTVQVLNVSKICFTCHLSRKQTNKKQ